MSNYTAGVIHTRFTADMGPFFLELNRATAQLQRFDRQVALLNRNLNSISMNFVKTGAATNVLSNQALRAGRSLAATAGAMNRAQRAAATATPQIQHMTASMNRLTAAGYRSAQMFRMASRQVRNFALAGAVVIGLSTREFVKYEQAMVRTTAVLGLLDAKDAQIAAQMGRRARDLALSTVFSAKEIAEGMQFMAMAGMDVVETYEGIENVISLATAGMMDISDAADIATNIMRGYGIEVEELGHVVDVMTYAFTNSNTNVRQLGDAFKYVAPIARDVGWEFEETAAAIGFLSDAGFQGEMAGTALRNVIMRLNGAVPATRRQLEELGIEAFDASNGFKSLADLLDAFNESGAETQDIMRIFMARAGPGFAILQEKGSAALRDMTERMEESAGTAAELERAIAESLYGKFRIFQAQLAEVGVILGDVFGAGFHQTLDLMSAFSNQIADNEAKVRLLANQLADEFVGVIQTVVHWYGRIGAAIVVVVDRVIALGQAMHGLSQGAMAPMTLGLQLLRGEITSLADVTEHMTGGWIRAGQAVDRLANGSEKANDIAALMVTGTEYATQVLQSFRDGLEGARGELEDMVTALEEAHDAVNRTSAALDAAYAFEDAYGGISSSLQQVAEGMIHLRGQQAAAAMDARKDAEARVRGYQDQMAQQRRMSQIAREQAQAARAAEEAARREAQERERANQAAAAAAQKLAQDIQLQELKLAALWEQDEVERRMIEHQAELLEIQFEGLDAELERLRILEAEHGLQMDLEGIYENRFRTRQQEADAYADQVRTMQEEYELLNAIDDLDTIMIEHNHELARIQREITDEYLRQLAIRNEHLKLSQRLAEYEKGQVSERTPGAFTQISAGFGAGVSGIAQGVGQEQDQAEKIRQLEEVIRLGETLEERLEAQNQLYDLQRQAAISAIDAQMEGLSMLAAEISTTSELVADLMADFEGLADSSEAVIAAMDSLKRVGAAAFQAMGLGARDSQLAQMGLNAALAATYLAMGIALGQPQFLMAAAVAGAQAVGHGLSAGMGSSVPSARQLPYEGSQAQQDSTRDAIIDALRALGLDGAALGDRQQNYYLYDPVAADRRDVQAKNLQDRAKRARLLTSE